MVTPTNLPVIVLSPTTRLDIIPDLEKNCSMAAFPILVKSILAYLMSASSALNLLVSKLDILPSAAVNLPVMVALSVLRLSISASAAVNLPVMVILLDLRFSITAF